MIDLGLDLFPFPAKTNSLYNEYIRIYNALRNIQSVVIEPANLTTITADKLSFSAKTGRMYFTTADTVNYGDWVVVYTDGNVHLNPYTLLNNIGIPASPSQIPEQRTPLFVTAPVQINAGDAVEVTAGGIVWVAQTLTPGTIYTLSGQTLVPINATLFHAYAGRSVSQHAVGMALSQHHLLMRRFS